MKIRNVTIHNWRSIKDTEIIFQNLMIFIGQNNHGKSNILSALLFFFGQLKHTALDFNKGSDELFVEVTFGELDENDKAQFQKYLTANGNIKIRKQATIEGDFAYHGYTQIPNADHLKEENISNYLTRDNAASTPWNNLLPEKGKLSRDIIRQTQEQYIANHSSELEFTYALETTNFLGFKTVAQGIFGDVFFIPAVKNASDEFNVKGNTIFNQLFSNVINKLSTDNVNYKNAKQEMVKLAGILNKQKEDGNENEERPKEISELEKKLESELKNWDTKIEIEITPPDIDEIFRVGTSVWVDDGTKTDINRKGHGLQRSLIFALIKSWAALLKETREKEVIIPEGGVAVVESPKRKTSESTYFFFEEPELYLHPQAQRELYESLKELTLSNNQVILSTHSSSFLDLEFYKSICIVYKKNLEEGSKILQCTEELFQPGDEKRNFNLVYWINPDRGELFFAKKVILVEGPTDKTVIPFLAKKQNLFRYDYTLIDCGGKDSIPIYLNLLNKFKIPYVAAYDKDHQAYKDAGQKTQADSKSALIEAKIISGLGSSVIFVNDIEEEIGIVEENGKSKPFIALQKISDNGFLVSAQLNQKLQTIYT